MSRPTDTLRGARMAFDAAAFHLVQPDLFGGVLPRQFWAGIAKAAAEQIEECNAYEVATGRAAFFRNGFHNLPPGDCDGEQAKSATPEPVSVQ